MSGRKIMVGQVWASTHSGDIHYGRRQRRRVVEVDWDGPFVYLQTEGKASTTRVRLRSARSFTIPGHRLVEDVAS